MGPPPIETSLVQAAQAQRVAGAATDRERAARERRLSDTDRVDLGVGAVEHPDAIRRLPQRDSEEAESEPDGPPPDRPRIDVHA